ncbi:MAG: Plasma membrane t-SNARE, secretory vesicle fusion [Alectoria fallacina]|uniref:Plasma membrane t-SNARE, secretory vesicle fusion n=1 Tax=Alectoria fallacina TaxID=1903189 RepID=A0A8H3FSL2_9LECA|nr:MAG: Plasma membrane t-SNARE, secretory vesicle fusion [Alectoria fallacina]
MAQYGGYNNGGGGGYGQANPYEQAGNRYEQQGGRYEQEAGNPYAQQASNPYASPPTAPQQAYGGRQQQGGYESRYGQAQTTNGGSSTYPAGAGTTGGGYVGGNDVEMTPMNGQAGAYGAQPSRDPNAILNECRDIDRGIDSIQRNLERLRFLQQRAISESDTSQNTETNRELDSLSSDTMTLYRSFAARIKSIKSQKESGDPRNKPQVGLVHRKLQSAINEYQNVEKEFRHKLSARMEREYRIVRPDASDQEVQEAIQDPSNTQVFTTALLSRSRHNESRSALQNVSSRHEAIQKIERQMVELAQLFQDMEAAVATQEPAIENTEAKTENTVENLDQGNKHLGGAVVKARSARRKKWICFWIVVLIVIIIGVAVGVGVGVTVGGTKKATGT